MIRSFVFRSLLAGGVLASLAAAQGAIVKAADKDNAAVRASIEAAIDLLQSEDLSAEDRAKALKKLEWAKKQLADQTGPIAVQGLEPGRYRVARVSAEGADELLAEVKVRRAQVEAQEAQKAEAVQKRRVALREEALKAAAGQQAATAEHERARESFVKARAEQAAAEESMQKARADAEKALIQHQKRHDEQMAKAKVEFDAAQAKANAEHEHVLQVYETAQGEQRVWLRRNGDEGQVTTVTKQPSGQWRVVKPRTEAADDDAEIRAAIDDIRKDLKDVRRMIQEIHRRLRAEAGETKAAPSRRAMGAAGFDSFPAPGRAPGAQAFGGTAPVEGRSLNAFSAHAGGGATAMSPFGGFSGHTAPAAPSSTSPFGAVAAPTAPAAPEAPEAPAAPSAPAEVASPARFIETVVAPTPAEITRTIEVAAPGPAAAPSAPRAPRARTIRSREIH